MSLLMATLERWKGKSSSVSRGIADDAVLVLYGGQVVDVANGGPQKG
jgi:hypothetical protein